MSNFAGHRIIFSNRLSSFSISDHQAPAEANKASNKQRELLKISIISEIGVTKSPDTEKETFRKISPVDASALPLRNTALGNHVVENTVLNKTVRSYHKESFQFFVKVSSLQRTTAGALYSKLKNAQLSSKSFEHAWNDFQLSHKLWRVDPICKTLKTIEKIF